MQLETKCRNLTISCLFLTSKARIGSIDITSCSFYGLSPFLCGSKNGVSLPKSRLT
jgi:hypothetical protein